MAQIDTNIYGLLGRGVKSVQDYDQEAQATEAAKLGNLLNRSKIDEYQAGVQEKNALRSYLSGGANLSTPEGVQGLYRVAPTQAGSILKDQAVMLKEGAQARSANATASAAEWDLRLKKANTAISDIASLGSRDEAISSLQKHFQSGDLDEQKYQSVLQTIPQDPAQFPEWRKSMLMRILDAKTQLELAAPKISYETTGGTKVAVNTNAMAPGGVGPVAGVAPIKMTATPGEVLRDDATRRRQDKLSVTHGVKGLTPEQNNALFGPDGAVTTGRLDPGKINSKTASIFADAAIANPGTDFAKISGDIALGRNATFRQKAMIAETLPEIMQNMVDSGKKIGFSDVRTVGRMQAWVKGELNDPAMVEYMTQRNDALMTIAGVMRGVGMTDQAHRAETEVASPTMSPAALDAWMRGQMKALEPRLKQNRQIVNGASERQASSQPSANSAPVQLKSEADYHALKPGTRFITPDGKTGTKK